MYKVTLKTSYPQVEFEFDNLDDAVEFVDVALNCAKEPVEFVIRLKEEEAG